MSEFSEYYKRFFTKTSREEELEEKLAKLIADYEQSEPYLAYIKAESELFDELAKERTQKKIDMGPRPKRERGKGVKLNKDVSTVTVDYSEAEKVIEMYNSLDEKDKKYFRMVTGWTHTNLEDYKNPITKETHLSELEEILVQVCINYIKENNLTDIDEIAFNADSLQQSARFGKWTPATDAYLRAVGLVPEEYKETEIYVRKKIGEVW